MAAIHGAMIPELALKASALIRDMDPGNQLEYLRIRSHRHELMIAPGAQRNDESPIVAHILIRKSETLLKEALTGCSALAQAHNSFWWWCKKSTPADRLSCGPRVRCGNCWTADHL